MYHEDNREKDRISETLRQEQQEANNLEEACHRCEIQRKKFYRERHIVQQRLESGEWSRREGFIVFQDTNGYDYNKMQNKKEIIN